MLIQSNTFNFVNVVLKLCVKFHCSPSGQSSMGIADMTVQLLRAVLRDTLLGQQFPTKICRNGYIRISRKRLGIN